MQPTLIVIDGPAAGKRWPLDVGKIVTIGRVDQATIIIRDDPLLSNLHFALEWDGPNCRVRDLNSKFGITVNNVKVDAAVLHDGDRVKAGRSEFMVTLPTEQAEAGADGIMPPPSVANAPSPTTAAGEIEIANDAKTVGLLNFLRSQPAPLFALLDGARDMAIYLRLMECKEQYQTLYEGPQGEALAPNGPYLVSLPKDSPFLEMLVRDGWGKSWGVFLTSPAPFAELRRHLRKFLEAKLPSGKVVLFRFYDPRVLRVFLPTCTDEDYVKFLGPTANFVSEGDEKQMALSFSKRNRPSRVPLAAWA